MKMHSTDEVKKCSRILMFKCGGGESNLRLTANLMCAREYHLCKVVLRTIKC